MIELTGWGDLLRGIGLLYWLVAFGFLIYAIRKARGKRGWTRWRPIGLVLLIFFALPVGRILTNEIDHYQRKAKLDKAMARFEALCKTSGEFIHRTVDDVEGVFLMKLRPREKRIGALDMVDPYGYENDGSNDPFGNSLYVHGFLQAQDAEGFLAHSTIGAFRYVDLISPDDGLRYRYSAHTRTPEERSRAPLGPDVVLDRAPVLVEMALPRYGVTYDDITLPADRQMWIAGSSLKVVDVQTGEVLGERIGYVIDKGQGSRAAARVPWTYAMRADGWSCPQLKPSSQTATFVKKILKPLEN